MRRSKRIGLIMTAGLMTLVGCSRGYNSSTGSNGQETSQQVTPTEPGAQTTEPQSSEAQTSVVQTIAPTEPVETTPFDPKQQSIPTNIALASKISDLLKGDKNGNVLYSPLSLDMALGMTWPGANAALSEKYAAYYGASLSDYMDFAKYYTENSGDELSIANSVWFREGYSLKPEYEKAVRESFAAECAARAFNNDFVNEVNDWCSEKTRGMIYKILDDAPDSDTVTILINALYFNGQWAQGYGEYDLGCVKFIDTQGKYWSAQGMYSTENTYLENDAATGFMKYYQGGRYAFVGILPKEEGDFTLEELDIPSLLENRERLEVDVMIPQFEYENTSVLTQKLSVMGLEDALASNFDGMVEGDVLYIGNILQKTVIKVNEKGTEAAAVTVIEDKCECESMEVFLDRPFAFLIYDTLTGNVLFEGKVMLPDVEEIDEM